MFHAGTYELSIDAKSRLSVPFAIRRELSEQEHGHAFWVVPGRRRGTLTMHPKKLFEKLRADRPDDDELSDEAFEFRQWEDAHSVLLEPDSQGRVLVPERMLRLAGIEKEVALVARGEYLDLWPREAHEAFCQSLADDYPERRAKTRAEEKQIKAAKLAEARLAAAEYRGGNAAQV
jgi:MraZ protein